MINEPVESVLEKKLQLMDSHCFFCALLSALLSLAIFSASSLLNTLLKKVKLELDNLKG